MLLLSFGSKIIIAVATVVDAITISATNLKTDEVETSKLRFGTVEIKFIPKHDRKMAADLQGQLECDFGTVDYANGYSKETDHRQGDYEGLFFKGGEETICSYFKDYEGSHYSGHEWFSAEDQPEMEIYTVDGHQTHLAEEQKKLKIIQEENWKKFCQETNVIMPGAVPLGGFISCKEERENEFTIVKKELPQGFVSIDKNGRITNSNAEKDHKFYNTHKKGKAISGISYNPEDKSKKIVGDDADFKNLVSKTDLFEKSGLSEIDLTTFLLDVLEDVDDESKISFELIDADDLHDADDSDDDDWD